MYNANHYFNLLCRWLFSSIMDWLMISFHVLFTSLNEKIIVLVWFLGTSINLCPSISIDPEGRMAAVRVFSSHLALIPLTGNPSWAREHNWRFNSKSRHQLCSSNWFSSQSSQNLIFLPDSSIRPWQFFTIVAQMKEKVLLIVILHFPKNFPESFATRPIRKENVSSNDCCHWTSFKVSSQSVAFEFCGSFSFAAFQFTVVNCIEGVPFDAEGLHALPKPVGGLFISCNNLLLWCDISSSTVPYSIAFNQFAPLTYSVASVSPNSNPLNLSSLIDCRFVPLLLPMEMSSNVYS